MSWKLSASRPLQWPGSAARPCKAVPWAKAFSTKPSSNATAASGWPASACQSGPSPARLNFSRAVAARFAKASPGSTTNAVSSSAAAGREQPRDLGRIALDLGRWQVRRNRDHRDEIEACVRERQRGASVPSTVPSGIVFGVPDVDPMEAEPRIERA